MTTRRKIAIAAAALLLAAGTAAALMKPGEKFLPFSLKNIDGAEYTVKMEDGRLTLIVRGAPGCPPEVKTHPGAVLIDFWATWCVPCRASMPYMQKLHEKYGAAAGQESGGLRLFGIALDAAGSKVVKPFYDKLKITYPMLADPTAGAAGDGMLRTTKDMKGPYDAQAIPVVYVIDAKGTIVHVHQGFTPEHMTDLEAAVKAALAGGAK